MNRKVITKGILISFFVMLIVSVLLFLRTTSDLSKIHKIIENNYENVTHINADTFEDMPEEGMIVFDVREPDEFAVSHMPGAILVDPEISKIEFNKRFASQMKGKKAVFYCSVGHRSSNLANRVADIVIEQTNIEPINLIGGVFQWINEKRELITSNGETTHAIHPYNTYWGQLIKNEANIKFSPASPDE